MMLVLFSCSPFGKSPVFYGRGLLGRVYVSNWGTVGKIGKKADKIDHFKHDTNKIHFEVHS